MFLRKISIKGYIQILLLVFIFYIFTIQEVPDNEDPILFALNKMTYIIIAFLTIIYLESSKKK